VDWLRLTRNKRQERALVNILANIRDSLQTNNMHNLYCLHNAKVVKCPTG
jgi:hypothetical protein